MSCLNVINSSTHSTACWQCMYSARERRQLHLGPIKAAPFCSAPTRAADTLVSGIFLFGHFIAKVGCAIYLLEKPIRVQLT